MAEEETEKYEPRSEEELKQIALDIHAGKIYTSQHLKRAEDVRLVFMAAMLSGPEYPDWLEGNNIAVFYEHMENASPRSVNGCPMFLGHKHLSRDEWTTVLDKLKKIEEALEEI